jgi:hypothetical protein
VNVLSLSGPFDILIGKSWAVDLIGIYLRREKEDVDKMTGQSVSGLQVHIVVSINS